MERLLKGSKHPLHNPTTATIFTTGEEKETHIEIEITQTLHLIAIANSYTFTQILAEVSVQFQLVLESSWFYGLY